MHACTHTVSSVNTEHLHYLQDSDSQVDILHLPGTRCPAGGRHTSVDTAWHMTQIPGLVGILSHLKWGKIISCTTKVDDHRLCWLLKTETHAELIPVCTVGGKGVLSLGEYVGSASPQGLVLQGLTWFFSPWHFFPPFLGGGLEQERVRIERPPPQRLSQRDQGLHRDHPPSTAFSTDQ